MSDQDINIDVGMDPSAYLTGAQQVQTSNKALIASFGAITGTSGTLHKALELVTPGKTAIAAWAATAVQAGRVQQSLSGLRATSVITGVSVDKLTGTMHSLAKTFPIGNEGAQALVTQFTQLGVASKGSEAKIAGLAEATTKFSGATGQDLASAAQGLTDFSRATGNVSLDVKPYQDLSDAVTTVSAKYGASAESIETFGKNIAPMAGVAGIGAAGIVGISGAFAKLGEDGIGATTAVNKMLGDMSKSVRDGTPDLAIYSSAVGKTTKEFTALYKANPAEALTQVTEAIAKSATGPRLLEQLGLDSVRTMKSLTALSASGGLRPAIATAVQGYGSGSSEMASKEAFDGLSESAIELQAALGQLSAALGKPLLSPLTAFTRALSGPAKMLAGVAGNEWTQKIASGVMGTVATVGTAVIGGLVLPKVAKLIGNYAMGRQMFTSSPAVLGSAGYAQGAQLGPDSKAYRHGEQGRVMLREGTVGSGPLGRLNTAAYEKAVARGEKDFARRTTAWTSTPAGRTWAQTQAAAGQTPTMASTGAAMKAQQAEAATSRAAMKASQAEMRAATPPTRGQTFRAGVGGWTRALVGTAYTTGTETVNQANTPTSQRSALLGYRKEADMANADIRARNAAMPAGQVPLPMVRTALHGVTPRMQTAVSEGLAQGGGMKSPITMMKGMTQSLTAQSLAAKDAGAGSSFLAKASKEAGVALSMLGKRVQANAGMFMTGAKDASMATGMAGKAGAWAAGGLGMLTSPMMVAMGVGMAGMKIKSMHDEKTEKTRSDKRAFDASDIYSISNAYKASAGMATKTAVAQTAVASGAPKASSVATVDSVSGKVTSAEIAASKTGKNVHTYVPGTNKDYVAQILAGAPGGLSPADMATRRQDLLHQGVKAADVEAISADVAKQGRIITPESGVESIPTKKGQPIVAAGTGTALANSMYQEVLDATGNPLPKDSKLRVNADSPYSDTIVAPLTAAQHKAGQAAVSMLGQQTVADQGRAGPEHAAQESYRAASTMYTELVKTGKLLPEALNEMSTQLLTQINPGGKNNTPVTAEEFKKYSGNFAEILRAREKEDPSKGTKFSDDLKLFEAKGLTTKMTGGLKGDTLPGEFSEMLKSSGDDFGADLFNQNNVSKFGKALAESVHFPAAADVAQNLLKESLAFGKEGLAAGKTGMSGDAIGQMSMGNIDKLVAKIAQMDKTIGNSPQGNPATDAMIQARNALQTQVQAQQVNMTPGQAQVSGLKSAMTAAEIEVGPTTNPDIVAKQKQGVEDTATGMAALHQRLQQRLEAQRSYEIAVTRTVESANMARDNAQDAYDRQRVNSQFQFHLQMKRGQEDYDLSVKNAKTDFNLTRHNEIRDYNTTMARQEQDYLRGRKIAIRDFNKSVKRMVEDGAANLYDPYTRIQTKATWDTKNLMGNMKQQNEAMVKQKNQLNLLRKQGLSQQVIDELKLGDVSNAQQVNQMVGDFKKNPNEIKQFNRLGKQRGKAAEGMVTDASNIGLTRSRADFNTQMNDQAKAQKIAVKRAGADLARGLSDQLKSFNVSMRRTSTAYRLQVSRSVADNARGLRLMAAENGIARRLARTALNVTLRNMRQDIQNSDRVIGGTTAQLVTATQAAMRGQHGAFASLIVNDTNTVLREMSNLSRRAAAIAAGRPAAPVATPTGSKPLSTFEKRHGWSEGGPIKGSSPNSKADNLEIMATAGEFMQPVAAVQHYGLDKMEAVRTRKATISMGKDKKMMMIQNKQAQQKLVQKKLVQSKLMMAKKNQAKNAGIAGRPKVPVTAKVSQSQGQMLNASKSTHMTINHNEKINNDYRNDFGNANITIKSNNPDDMAKQLSKKATAQKINQTRSVQWTKATH